LWRYFWWRHLVDVMAMTSQKWRHNWFFWRSISSQSAWKTTIWTNHVTLSHQYGRLRDAGGGEHSAFCDFWKFVSEIMHFRHISAKIQPKNLKEHFDWGGPAHPLATPLCIYILTSGVLTSPFLRWLSYGDNRMIVVQLPPSLGTLLHHWIRVKTL